MTRRRRVSADAPAIAAGPAGAVFDAAAGALSQLSSRVGALADQAAQEEGALAGAREGLSPEFRPRRDGTIRGRAYDQSGLRSMALRTNTAVRQELASAFDAADGDVNAFAAAADALRAKYVETAPDELRADLETDFVAARFGYDREFVRLADTAEADALSAEAMGLLDGRVKDIGRSAYQLGLDGPADATLASELATLTSDVIAYGPKTAFTFRGVEYGADPSRAGVLSLDQIETTLQRTGSLVGVNRVKGAFGRLKGLEAKRKFHQGFMADYGEGEGVAGTMDLTEVEGLENEMLAEIRSLEAEAGANAAAVRSRVTEVRSRLREYRGFARDGLVPPPDELAALEAEATATGDMTLVNEVREIGALTSLARVAVRTSPVALAAEINQLRTDVKDGASPEMAARIGLLESTLAGMRTGLAQDPYGYAVRAGVIDPAPLQQGDALQLSLFQRAAQSRLVEQTYGVRGAMFTQAEMDQIKAVDAAGGAEIIQLSSGIVEAMGPDAGPVLDRISARAPLVGHLGGLMMSGGSRDAVNAAAEGRRLMAEPGGVAKGLSSTTSGLAAQSLLEGPLGENGAARQAIEEAANAIYLGRKGLNADFDKAAFTRALQEASGAVFIDGRQYGGITQVGEGWFNGPSRGEVVLPSWLKADLADEAISGLSLEDYATAGNGTAPMFGDGSAAPLSSLKAARLVTVAPGVYRLALGDPGGDDPRYLMGRGEGGLYELDLNRVREAIAMKVPEAVGP